MYYSSQSRGSWINIKTDNKAFIGVCVDVCVYTPCAISYKYLTRTRICLLYENRITNTYFASLL